MSLKNILLRKKALLPLVGFLLSFVVTFYFGGQTLLNNTLASLVHIQLAPFVGRPTSASIQLSDINTGLIGYWKFDEGNGTTAIDSSGNGNNGVLTNGPTYSSTVPPTHFSDPYSLNFNGTSNYVDTPANSLFNFGTGDFTLSTWVYPTNIAAGYQILIGKDSNNARQWTFNIGVFGKSGFANGYVDFYQIPTATSVNSETTLIQNTWNLVTLTRAAGIDQIYVNGFASGSPVNDTTNDNLTNKIQFGEREYVGYPQNFYGSLDDVRIYNRALSAIEISALYNGNSSGTTWTPTGPSRYWTDITMSSDGKIQTATTYNDQIYTSTDSGVTWTARDSARNWQAVAMSADGIKQTAVVTGGQIYTSTDSGVTWKANGPSGVWDGVAMSSDGKIQTVVPYGGQIYTSTDFGVTWTATASNKYWSSVAMSSTGNIQAAVVTEGQIYISIDSGVTWTARGPSGVNWEGVAMNSAGNIQAAIISGGQIYTSTDSGVTWKANGPSGQWTDIAMSGDPIIAAITWGGQIYNSVLSDSLNAAPPPINTGDMYQKFRNWWNAYLKNLGFSWQYWWYWWRTNYYSYYWFQFYFSPPQIAVSKIVINHGGTLGFSSFPLKIDGKTVLSGQTTTVSAGPHTICEAGKPNYKPTWSGDCPPATGSYCNIIMAVAGRLNTCIITNEEINNLTPAYITIKKILVTSDKTKKATDWQFIATDSLSGNNQPQPPANLPIGAGAGALSGQTLTLDQETQLHPGLWTISEGPTDPNYQVAFGDDCNAGEGQDFIGGQNSPGQGSATIMLSPGDHRICTITNTQLGSSLTIHKWVNNCGVIRKSEVSPSGGTGNAPTGTACNGTKQPVDFGPTITITNLGTLNKFTYSAIDSPTTFNLDAPKQLPPGTYQISEDLGNFPNYQLTGFKGDCTNTGLIRISTADSTPKTCTITNTFLTHFVCVKHNLDQIYQSSNPTIYYRSPVVLGQCVVKDGPGNNQCQGTQDQDSCAALCNSCAPRNCTDKGTSDNPTTNFGMQNGPCEYTNPYTTCPDPAAANGPQFDANGDQIRFGDAALCRYDCCSSCSVPGIPADSTGQPIPADSCFPDSFTNCPQKTCNDPTVYRFDPTLGRCTH